MEFQSARPSSETNLLQCTAAPDLTMTMNQLSAKVQDQEHLLQTMQCHMSQMCQSVSEQQRRSLWLEYLNHRNTLTGYQHQLSVEYAQSYGILPLYRGGPSGSETVARQPPVQQQQHEHQLQHAASVVAQHQGQAYHVHEEVSHVPDIPDPPPSTPTQHHMQYCYAPHILNEDEVEQGRRERATVWFNFGNEITNRMHAQPYAASVITPMEPVDVPVNNNTVNQHYEPSPEMEKWASVAWPPYSTEQNFPFN